MILLYTWLAGWRLQIKVDRSLAQKYIPQKTFICMLSAELFGLDVMPVIRKDDAHPLGITGGNLAMRVPEGILVTPTNAHKGQLRPEDLVLVKSIDFARKYASARVTNSRLAPSTDTPLMWIALVEHLVKVWVHFHKLLPSDIAIPQTIRLYYPALLESDYDRLRRAVATGALQIGIVGHTSPKQVRDAVIVLGQKQEEVAARALRLAA